MKDICPVCGIYTYVAETYEAVEGREPLRAMACDKCYHKAWRRVHGENKVHRYILECSHGISCGHKHKTCIAAFYCKVSKCYYSRDRIKSLISEHTFVRVHASGVLASLN